VTILDDAAATVDGPRAETYGDSTATCTAIGRVWGALLRIDDIDPATVAEMMVALKLVRDTGPKPERDNLVDAAGYLLIAERAREPHTPPYYDERLAY